MSMTGNPNLDKAILGINGLGIILATALVVYSHTMINRLPTNEEAEFSNMVKTSIEDFQKPTVEFKEQVLNLYSREARLRFLNLQMNIETFDQNQINVIEIRKPMILDVLIDITSNMSPNEVNSVTGRLLLEARLKKIVNSKLKEPAVKKVYFSKFIVQ
jgi:flagellar FliL protein